MGSSFDKAKDVLDITKIVYDALTVIASLTRSGGGDKSSATLQTIGAIIDSLRDGVDGKTSIATLEAELDAILASSKDRDALWRDRLADKFDLGGES